jgi:hypothetical protein
MPDEINVTMKKFGFNKKFEFKVTSYIKFKKLYSSDFDKDIKKKSDDDDLITKELEGLFEDTLSDYIDKVIQDDDFEVKFIDEMKQKCDFADLTELSEFSELGKVMLRFDRI